MSKVYENRNLLLYFLIAYGFSWLFWIPEALAARGLLGSSILVDFLLSPYNPAAFGPLVSAVLLTFWYQKGRGVIGLLKKGVDYRFAKVWWIPTILLLPMISGGALLMAILAGESIPELYWVASPFLIVVNFVVYLLTGGPLQEEFGWRGYALPRLQSRFTALISSVILGVMWTFWHLPYYFIGQEVYVNIQVIPSNLLGTILITILITWLYNNTGGSILVTMIFHNMLIMGVTMFPAVGLAGGLSYVIFLIAATIAVVAIWGYKRLVREPKKEG